MKRSCCELSCSQRDDQYHPTHTVYIERIYLSMEPAEEQNNNNRDSDLEAFQEKILAKCDVRMLFAVGSDSFSALNNNLNKYIQIYRSAQKKDSAKLSEIRQELEADFALKSKADILSAIEAHKREIKSLTEADE